MRYYVRLVQKCGFIVQDINVFGTLTEAKAFKRRKENKGYTATIYKIELIELETLEEEVSE